MKIAVLLRPVRAMQRLEARDLLPVAALAQTQSERHRRLALATGFGSQAVWNKSTRCAGARGGARVGRPRWLRILTITGGSSIAAMIFNAAAAVRAVFDVDVEDPFEQPGPTHARRRALRVSVIVGSLQALPDLGMISQRNFAFGPARHGRSG